MSVFKGDRNLKYRKRSSLKSFFFFNLFSKECNEIDLLLKAKGDKGCSELKLSCCKLIKPFPYKSLTQAWATSMLFNLASKFASRIIRTRTDPNLLTSSLANELILSIVYVAALEVRFPNTIESSGGKSAPERMNPAKR